MATEYHVPCPRGVEAALASELEALGVSGPRMSAGGAVFKGGPELVPKLNLWLRSAIRVQELLVRGPASDPDALYRLAASIPWESMVRQGDTISVRAALEETRFRDSRYPALVVKDAVVDRIRDHFGWRPSVDRKTATLPLRIFLRRSMAFIYRDTSGGSLHKRGYRPVQVKSPLNEALAAGLLMLGAYDGQGDFVDPMCGSGTFCIEAAMMAKRRAPGMRRNFAFLHWPGADLDAWGQLKSEAEEGEQELEDLILGSDHHPGAVSIAQRSAKAAGFGEELRFGQSNLRSLSLPEPPTWVAVNPPFGERLGEGPELEEAWTNLGRFLKDQCPEAKVLILCGDPALSRHLRLKANHRFPVRNGPLDCRLLCYRILPPRKD